MKVPSVPQIIDLLLFEGRHFRHNGNLIAGGIRDGGGFVFESIRPGAGSANFEIKLLPARLQGGFFAIAAVLCSTDRCILFLHKEVEESHGQLRSGGFIETGQLVTHGIG